MFNPRGLLSIGRTKGSKSDDQSLSSCNTPVSSVHSNKNSTTTTKTKTKKSNKICNTSTSRKKNRNDTTTSTVGRHDSNGCGCGLGLGPSPSPGPCPGPGRGNDCRPTPPNTAPFKNLTQRLSLSYIHKITTPMKMKPRFVIVNRNSMADSMTTTSGISTCAGSSMFSTCTTNSSCSGFRKTSSSCNRIRPQQYLDQLLTSKGYSTTRYNESLVFSEPTSYQKVCFHTRLVEIIKRQPQNSETAFHDLFTAGLSTNPYDNQSGLYLIHMVCQHSCYKILDVMLEHGGSSTVQVVDIYGRNPLHAAIMYSRKGPMSSPKLRYTVSKLLEVDSQLLYWTDCRNAEPLSYIPQDQYDEWIQFLKSNQHTFWPVQEQPNKDGPGEETFAEEVIRTTACPTNETAATTTETIASTTTTTTTTLPLTMEVAALLAAGRMNPEEISVFRYKHDENKNHHDSIDCCTKQKDEQEKIDTVDNSATTYTKTIAQHLDVAVQDNKNKDSKGGMFDFFIPARTNTTATTTTIATTANQTMDDDDYKFADDTHDDNDLLNNSTTSSTLNHSFTKAEMEQILNDMKF